MSVFGMMLWETLQNCKDGVSQGPCLLGSVMSLSNDIYLSNHVKQQSYTKLTSGSKRQDSN